MASNFNSFNSIYIMNKIFKYLLGIFSIFLIGTNLCNALNIETTITSYNGSYYDQSVSVGNYDFVCVQLKNNGQFFYNFDHGGNADTLFNHSTICVDTGSIYYTANSCEFDIIHGNEIGECQQCETCEEQYTSLECQTEYNLIPINSVTKSYCELNFNLIDPSSCPISEGSGVVNWSSLFINNTQYAGNENIEIFIPDFIGRSIIYNSGSNYIDIEGYNADTEYIDNIIAQEKITPTNEDIEYFIGSIANYLPLVFITLFAILIVKRILSSFK